MYSNLNQKAQRGFTLLEIISSLVLLSVLGLGFSSFIVHGVEAFILARENNESFQKVDIAMGRLISELKNSELIYEATATGIRLERDGQPFGIASAGNEVRVIRNNALPTTSTGFPLIDNVTAFALAYEDSAGNAWTARADNSVTGLSRIRVSITVAVSDTTRSFSVDINPIYNDLVNGPTS